MKKATGSNLWNRAYYEHKLQRTHYAYKDKMTLCDTKAGTFCSNNLLECTGIISLNTAEERPFLRSLRNLHPGLMSALYKC